MNPQSSRARRQRRLDRHSRHSRRRLDLELLEPRRMLDGTLHSAPLSHVQQQQLVDGLKALAQWTQRLDSFGQFAKPLVTTGTNLGSELGLAGLLQTYLAAPLEAGSGPSGDTDDIVDVLKGLSTSLPGLTITVDPASVTGGKLITANGSEVQFNLTFQAQRSQQTPLELGAAVAQTGLTLQPSVTVTLETSVSFDFTFGLDLAPGLDAAEAFFVRVDALHVAADVSESSANMPARVGILDVALVGVNLEVVAAAEVLFTNPDSDAAGNITRAEMENSDVSGLVVVTTTSDQLNATLPLAANLGSYTFPGSPTLTLSGTAFGGSAVPAFNAAFAELQYFDRLAPANLLTALDRVGQSLDRIAAQWDVNPTSGGIPYVVAQVSDVADMTSLLERYERGLYEPVLTGTRPASQRLAGNTQFSIRVNDDQAYSLFLIASHQTEFETVASFLNRSLPFPLAGKVEFGSTGGPYSHLTLKAIDPSIAKLEVVLNRRGDPAMTDLGLEPGQTTVPVLKFDSVQTFVPVLAGLMGIAPALVNPQYDPIARSLTFRLQLQNQTFTQSVSLDFRDGLGPLTFLNAPSATFSATPTVIGQVGIGLEGLQTVFTAAEPAPLDGRLSSTATFRVSIDSSQATTVTVAPDPTNATLDDLIADVNAGLVVVGLDSLVVAGRDGNRITLTTHPRKTLAVTSDPLDPARTQLYLDGFGAGPQWSQQVFLDAGMQVSVASQITNANISGEAALGILPVAISGGAIAMTLTSGVTLAGRTSLIELERSAESLLQPQPLLASLAGRFTVPADATYGVASPAFFDLGLATPNRLDTQIVASAAAPLDGRLTTDARFTLTVGDREPAEVVVPADATNQSLDDLLADINAALRSARLASLVVAQRSGDRVTLATDGTYSLRLESLAGNASQTELHLNSVQLGPAVTYVGNSSFNNHLAALQNFDASPLAETLEQLKQLFDHQNGALPALTNRMPLFNKSIDEILDISGRLSQVVQELEGQAGVILKQKVKGILDQQLLPAIRGLPDSVAANDLAGLETILDGLRYAVLYEGRVDTAHRVHLPSYVIASVGPLSNLIVRLQMQGVANLEPLRSARDALAGAARTLPTLIQEVRDALPGSNVQFGFVSANAVAAEPTYVVSARWAPEIVSGTPLRSLQLPNGLGPLRFSPGSQANLQVTGDFQFDVGYNLATDTPLLLDSSRFKATTSVNTVATTYQAAIGGASVALGKSTSPGFDPNVLRLSTTGGAVPAVLQVTVTPTPDPNDLGAIPFTSVATSLNASAVNGTMHARLPIYLTGQDQGDIVLDWNFQTNQLDIQAPTQLIPALQNVDFDFQPLKDGIHEFLQLLEQLLSDDILGALPLVGSGLNLEDGFLGRLQNQFYNSVSATLDTAVPGDGNQLRFDLHNAIVSALQPILISTASHVTAQSVLMDFVIRGSDVYTAELDLGLPGLGLQLGDKGEVPLSVDYDLKLTFVLDKIQGFYFDIVPAGPQFTFDVSAAVSDQFEFEGAFLGMPVVLQTKMDGAQSLTRLDEARVAVTLPDPDGQLTFEQLDPLNFQINFGSAGAHAQIDMQMVANTSLGGDLDLPALAADLQVMQDFGPGVQLNDSGAVPRVSLKNIRLPLGSAAAKLVKPVVDQLNEYLAPIRPLITLLEGEVPVLSDLSRRAAGKRMTWLDAIRTYSNDPFVDQSITNIQKVLDILRNLNSFARTAESFASRLGELKFGDFDFYPPINPQDPSKTGPDLRFSDPRQLNPLQQGHFTPAFAATDNGQNTPEVNDTDQEIGAFLDEDLANSGVRFPIFEDPENVLRWLFGEDVALVTWDLPEFGVTASPGDVFLGVIPVGPVPVNVSAGLDFGVGFNVGLGLSTRGLRDDLTFADGFFFQDEGRREPPVVALKAGIHVNATVGVPLLAEAGYQGRLTATIGAYWKNDNRDDKVYLDEIEANLDQGPHCIFDIGGSLSAQLLYFVRYLVGGTFTFPLIPEVTIFDFTIGCPPLPPPELAHISDGSDLDFEGNTIPSGTLVLNVGAFAHLRQPGYSKDRDERIHVYEFEPGVFTVTGFGQSKQYGLDQPITAIYGDAGVGKNLIQLDATVAVPATLVGGGDDQLRGGSAPNRILGRGGRDVLVGGGANDTIIAGIGEAQIFGGPGEDLLIALGGVNFIDGDDGSDTIHGGTGPDIILGGDGADSIRGGGGFDRIFGERGSDLIIGEGIDGVYIEGGRGDNLIEGSDGPDLIYAVRPHAVPLEAGRNTVYGAAGNDQIHGGDDNFNDLFGDAGDDTIYGGQAADFLHAGSGTDLVFGGDGDDVIFADSGRNTLYGGLGNDTIFGSSGTGPTRPVNWPTTLHPSYDPRFAGNGEDTIYGEVGIDFIYGGVGSGLISGGPFNDFLYGGTGSHVLHGDSGDDYLHTGDGNQHIIGDEGDDLVVQSLAGDQSLSDTVITGRGTTTLTSIERATLINESLTGGQTFRVEGWTRAATLVGSAAGNDRVAAVADADYVLADGNLKTSFGGSFFLVGITRAALSGISLDNTMDVSSWTGTATLTGGSGWDRVVSINDADFVLSTNSLTRSIGGSFTLNNIQRVVLGGGPGNNRFDASGYDGMVAIYGGDGDDTLLGGSGADYLDGGTGQDVFDGGAGDDVLVGLLGQMLIMQGGSGDDLIYGSETADAVDGQDGHDRIYGRGGDDLISGGSGDDTIDGGSGDDTVWGETGADLITGGGGHDVLHAFGDTGRGLVDDAAVNYVYGDFGTGKNEVGAGNDQIFGSLGNDLLFGEAGTDVIHAPAAGSLVQHDAGLGPAVPMPEPPLAKPDGWPPVAPHARVTLPAGPDYRGRWTEYAGSASGGGVSNSPAAAFDPAIVAGTAGQYVAWSDGRSGVNRIYAALHTNVGWQQLSGSAHGAGITSLPGTGTEPRLALDALDRPVVAWTQSDGSHSDIYVAAYDPLAGGGAGGWVGLGDSLAAGGMSGTGKASGAEIVTTNDGLVIAWLDHSGGTTNVYARRFDGHNWVPLGAGSDSGQGISQSSTHVRELALATNGSRVAAAWSQDVGGRTQIYLREYAGGAWGQLDNSATGSGVSSTMGQARRAGLAYAGGELFVAWEDNTSGHDEIYAARWDGNAWLAAGTNARSGAGVSSSRGRATQPQLAAFGGRMYLVWLHDRLANWTGNATAIYVKRWNGQEFEEELVGDASHRGIADRVVDPRALVLSVDEVGHPFVAWTDVSSGKPEIYMRGNTFDIGTVHYVNDADAAPGDALSNSFATAPGSNTNDGLSAQTPKHSIQAVLASATLNPGDVILVDSGTYSESFLMTAAASGVLLRGSPHEPARLTGLARLQGSSDVTLQHLTLVSGLVSTDDTRMTLVDNDVQGLGVQVRGGSHAQLLDNRIDARAYGVTLGGAADRPYLTGNQIQAPFDAVRLSDSGATDVILRKNRLGGSGLEAVGIAFTATSTGRVSENYITSAGTGLQIAATFGGIIEQNDISGALVGVQYDIAALLSDNRIHHNGVGVLSTVESSSEGLGFFGSTSPNLIYQNSIGVFLQDATMQGQRVFANELGVDGTGVLGGSQFERANLIERNVVGVDFEGPVHFNRIGRNQTGLVAKDEQIVSHNVFYRNQSAAIQVVGKRGVQIAQNTLFSPYGDLLRIESGSREVEVVNNIFWSEGGYDLFVANDSQTGFYSDYNTLHASGNGKLVHWSNYSFTDVLDWQEDVTRFDLHSQGRTDVNPRWSAPRFVDKARDNYSVFPLFAGQRLSSPTIDAGDVRYDRALPAAYRNVLLNAGFEAGLADWNLSPGAALRAADPVAYDGAQYFSAGASVAGFVEQTVQLLPAGYTPAQLDGGSLVAVFGGRVRSAAESSPDRGHVTLKFFDESGGLLGESTVAASNVSERWELVGGRAAVPAGTRRIGFRFDAARQSGPTNDSFLDSAFVYLLHNAIGVDLGASGHTAVDVPIAEGGIAATTATQPHIALRSPDLYVDWQRDQTRSIRWDTYHNQAELPVRIDLYRDSSTGPILVTNIALATEDDGAFDWQPSDSGIDYGTHGLRIQVSLVGDPVAVDRSTEAFAVPENTTTFFVNDRISAGEQYTTAPGSNRNTGKLAGAPKPYPNNILRTYSLGPTHTLYVDAGDYALMYPLVVSNAPGFGDDEGFVFMGPTSGQQALLRHANPAFTSAPVIDVNDADFLTLAHLSTSGGTIGLWVHGGSTDFMGRHLAIALSSSDGIRFESSSSGSTLDHVTVTGSGGYGIYVSGPLDRIADSDVGFSGLSGVYLIDTANTAVEANVIHDNRSRGIEVVRGSVTIGNPDLSLGRGNIVRANADHGIQTQHGALIVGNTVSGHRGPGRIGIHTPSEARYNVVFDNTIGIDGGGVSTGNRVYQNLTTGIYLWGGTASENVVYANGSAGDGIGIQIIGNGSTLRNNIIYDNGQYGVYVRGQVTGVSLISNTVVQSLGNAVHLAPQVSNVQLRNNILWAAAGYAVVVPSNSQAGFQSDHNLLYATGAGRIGSWQGSDRATLADWQNATFLDQNTLSQDPRFVNRAAGDFHLQSPYGSFRGGSLAPVLDALTGLPIWPTPTLTLDPGQSPAIDRGAAGDGFANEPAPNGGYINLGAYGNTAQASLSPAEYVLVTRPDGGEVWPAGQTFAIRWRSHDAQGDVKIELFDSHEQLWGTIAAATPNDGEFPWPIPSDLPPDQYRVRVTRLDTGQQTDVSNTVFRVPAPVSMYYVNDAEVQPGDWTTAIGNDANDGLSPATPKASIRAVLEAYDLGPGDVIRVDVGTYTLTSNIVITSEDSGVRIEGYHTSRFQRQQNPLGQDEHLRAIIHRGNTAGGSYAFQFAGADDVTLDHLAITGGEWGVVALSGADSDRITITSSEIYGHRLGGISLDASNDSPRISGNRLYSIGVLGQTGGGILVWNTAAAVVSDNTVFEINAPGIDVRGAFQQTAENLVSGNEVYATTTGIHAASNVNYAPVMVRQNHVHDSTVGISQGNHNVTITGNTVHHISQTGISGTNVLENTVFETATGINLGGGGVARGNRVFRSNVGLTGFGSSLFEANHVYSNQTGVDAFSSAARVTNNLLYDHVSTAIRVRGSSGARVESNTVYETGAADAIRVEGSSNTSLRNNVLWVAQGAAVHVFADSQNGFASDYNSLFATNNGKLGRWSAREFTDLADWYYELGLDQHSQTWNPVFADPDGADDLLAYRTDAVGTVIIVDNDDPRFSITGDWDHVRQFDGSGGSFLENPRGCCGATTARWELSGIEDFDTSIQVPVEATWTPHRGLGSATYTYSTTSTWTVYVRQSNGTIAAVPQSKVQSGTLGTFNQATAGQGPHSLGAMNLTFPDYSLDPNVVDVSEAVEIHAVITLSAFTNVIADSVSALDDTVDDRDPRFSKNGFPWIEAGFDGGYHRRPASDPAATASWEFTGLLPGSVYDVATTWTSFPDIARSAVYTIYDGDNPVRWLTKDQLTAPNDFQDDGQVWWERLGYVQVTGSRLVVRVTGAGNLHADAVRLQRVAGDGGLDNDFHVFVTSPTIDAGDPQSEYLNEPNHHGGRINLGHTGNTPEATTSAAQFVQVLSPNGREKYEQGDTVDIRWRTPGVWGPVDYYANRILQDSPLAHYRLNESAATLAADRSGNGLHGTYFGGGATSVPGALHSEADTAVRFDGVDDYVRLPSGFADFRTGFTAEIWAYPTAVASWQRLFDLGNGANSDNILLYRDGTSNTLSFSILSGSTTLGVVRAPNAIELNKWQHFAVTQDAAGNVTLYKDGAVIATGMMGLPRNITRTSNFIGKSNWPDPLYAGRLDEAAIYATALSPAALREHFEHRDYGTVDIDLLRQGSSTPVLTIAQIAPNNGRFAWTVPTSVGEGNYAVRVRSRESLQPADVSDENFVIANNAAHYYVNDDSLLGDVFTTAIGNNAHSGKRPDQPMASLAALVAAYDLEPGDVIHVDTGVYKLERNILLDASDSGVRIEGPGAAGGAGQAILNRANVAAGSYVFQIAGADDVTLDHLHLTGAEWGVVLNSDSDSDRFTLSNSAIYSNASRGFYAKGNSDDIRLINNEFYDNSSGAIYVEYVSGMLVADSRFYSSSLSSSAGRSTAIQVFGYPGSNANTIRNNEIYNHGIGITAASNSGGPAIVQGNFLHDIRDVGISVSGAVEVFDNVVTRVRFGTGQGQGIAATSGAVAHDNEVFDSHRGMHVGAATAYDNRVYGNVFLGVSSAGGTLRGNTIYSNGVGIQMSSGGQAIHNLLYDNGNDGIWVWRDAGSVIENNTIYQHTTGDAIQVGGAHAELGVNTFSASNVTIKNNILVSAADYAVNVAADSELGFASDYNAFHVRGEGKLLRWDNVDFATLEQWYFETGYDLHSMQRDPLFGDLDGPDDRLGFDRGTLVDYGRDDTFLVRAVSPTIDAGDPAASYASEPAPHGGRVNLGHTGNTGRATVSSPEVLQILAPNGLEKFESGQEVVVSWHSSGFSTGARFDLEVSLNDGLSWTTIATDRPVNAAGRGSHVWIATGLTVGHTGRIRVTARGGAATTDQSDRGFLVAGGGRDFYVNDASLVGDVFTTIAGNNFASGKSPHEPMASLRALLAAYDLEPGDVVHVDAGTYRLYRSLLLAPQDSGVRIEGPGAVAEGQVLQSVALINRGNIHGSQHVFELAGADDVTIDHLSITGGVNGVYVPASADSDRLTVSHSDVFANTSHGIVVEAGNEDARILSNRVHSHTGFNGATGIITTAARAVVEDNQVYGNIDGMYVYYDGPSLADRSTVRGNTARDNARFGIRGHNQVLLENNIAHGHTAAGAVGIEVASYYRSAEATANTAFDNKTGILAASSNGVLQVVADNRVYQNERGIRAQGVAQLLGNQVYSNGIGISGDSSAGFHGLIANNIVYANSNHGIFIERSFNAGGRIVNNTVYQSVGDAVRLENVSQGMAIRSNILWTEAGSDIFVANNSSTSGIVSNANVLHQGTGPNARVGFWGGVARDTLTEWQAASGQDLLSVAADPLLVDRDGADNVLGFRTSDGFDGSADDNFHLLRTSPAIDRGDSTGALATDRDGYGRVDDPGTPNVGPSIYDIGAHEFQGSSFDTTAPQVVRTEVRVVGPPGALRSEILVVFSEPIDSIDARALANYEFREAGGNGQFGDLDDTVYALEPHYDDFDTDVVLRIVGSTGALPAGNYRLFVSGSSSIHDLAGNKLDGNGDGQEGDDFTAANQPPVVAPIANQQVAEGQTWTLDVVASDAQPLTYSLAAGAPAGATIHPTTGQLQWTPDEAHGPGEHVITVVVTDAGSPTMSSSRQFTVEVTETNRAPVFAAVNDVEIDELALFSVFIEASDPDAPANAVRYSLAAGAPDGAVIDAVTGEFRWTPKEQQGPGVFRITVIATDDGEPSQSAELQFDITVRETNRAPVLGLIPNRTVLQGQTVAFTAAAVDLDAPANVLTFSLGTGTPSGAEIDPVTGVFRWTPSTSVATGEYVITVHVEDDGSPRLGDMRNFTLKVEAPPDSPPTLLGFLRHVPMQPWTNADVLVFRALFDEEVTGVGIEDFVVQGATTANVSEVSMISGSEYLITVSGGDLANFAGNVGLDLSAQQNIRDLGDNPLPAAEPVTDERYTLDNTSPLADILDIAPDPRHANVGVISVQFDEDVTGVDISDFQLTRNGQIIDISSLAVAQDSAREYSIDLSTVTGLDGVYQFSLVAASSGIRDAAGNVLLGNATEDFVIDTAAPVVHSIAYGSGGAQRSVIRSITVDFDSLVAIDAGAFVLTAQNGTNIPVSVDVTTVAGRTRAVLTFSGAQVDATGSLKDGNYQLRILSTHVRDAAGNALDGDADGTAGGDRVDQFFRFFGDADGDRDVDLVDYALFRRSLNMTSASPLYNPAFDVDDDGDVDLVDFAIFRRNQGKQLPP